MAPRPPIACADLLRMLRAPGVRLPLHLGWPHHRIAVCREAGRWLLRDLVLDGPRCDTLRQQRLAAGLSFMPEHAETCLVPGPKVLREAESLDAFCRILETGPWPPW